MNAPGGPNRLRLAAVRVLMRLHPRRLREEYGEEMEDMVLARLERASETGLRGVLAAWVGTAWDVVVTRFTRRSVGGPRRAPGRYREKGMTQLFSDLRYATRRLLRTPVFTMGALAIMAIAIGANTAVFAIVNQVLLRPPPYAQPDRVVNIYQDSDDGDPSSTSFPAYRDMAAIDGVFESVSATMPRAATLDMGDGTQAVSVEFSTASYLTTVGRPMTRGRWFDPEMDVVGAGYYGVVSHHTWENRFGSDPDIVGRTVQINRNPVTVTGVGPEGINGIGGFVVTDFFLSISSVEVGHPSFVDNLDRRQDHWYDVRARLLDGVTVAQAQQAMDGLALSLAEEFPELNRGRDITVFESADIRLHPDVDGDLLPVAGGLMTIVFLVLIIACANLGGLLLVRGVARGSEVAVRRALGAASRRVARLFLGEALLLSVIGGLLGLVLARWLLALLALVPLPGPLSGDLDMSWDLSVLGFSLALMLATGLFFGLAPALQSLRTDVAGVLREDQVAQGRTRRMSFLRNSMVAMQVAVSLILVVGASVMVRSLASYGQVDPGVDVDRVAYIQTSFSQADVPTEEYAPTRRELEEVIANLPGVTDVAFASRLPVEGGGTTTTLIEGYEPSSGTGSVELDWALVSPGYFRALGIDVREGRGYRPEDVGGDERIVVVNEAAVAAFWSGQNAVDRRIRPQSRPDDWVRVVGVVSDTKIRSLTESPRPILYYLMGEAGVGSPNVIVRTANDPAAIVSSLRTSLGTVNGRLPVTRLGTLESHLGDGLAVPRLSAGLLSLFSFLALCLAGVGVYTIVSFSVAGRRREVGIRVALGAERGRVIRTVVAEVAWIVGLGLLIGTAIVALVSPRLQGLLYGTDILSFGTLGSALAILAAAVAFASLIPAWRATRVDPVEALRGS